MTAFKIVVGGCLVGLLAWLLITAFLDAIGYTDSYVDVRDGCAVEVTRDPWGNVVDEARACPQGAR